MNEGPTQNEAPKGPNGKARIEMKDVMIWAGAGQIGMAIARRVGVGKKIVVGGQRGARLNDIAPGIIVTPLALDEFNGPRGDFYKNMFANCPAGRPSTADGVANVAELLMSDRGAFITGSTFLVDGGATASYFYGPLKPGAAQD